MKREEFNFTAGDIAGRLLKLRTLRMSFFNISNESSKVLVHFSIFMLLQYKSSGFLLV